MTRPRPGPRLALLPLLACLLAATAAIALTNSSRNAWIDRTRITRSGDARLIR